MVTMSKVYIQTLTTVTPVLAALLLLRINTGSCVIIEEYGDEGRFLSPYYPAPYLPGLSLRYVAHLTTHRIQEVRLDYQIDLDSRNSNNECGGDKIVLWPSSQIFCGHTSGTAYIALDGDTFELLFESDDYGDGQQGFNITYTVHADFENAVYVQGNSGTFLSPNYPKPYANLFYMVYWATLKTAGPKQIRLEYDIDLEHKDGCIYDNITVPPPSSQVLCGTEKGTTYFSIDNAFFFLIFKTDHNFVGRGFNLTYTVLEGDCHPTITLNKTQSELELMPITDMLTRTSLVVSARSCRGVTFRLYPFTWTNEEVRKVRIARTSATTLSEILACHSNDNCPYNVSLTHDVAQMDCDQFRDFWLRWDDQGTEIGTGTVVGSNIFLRQTSPITFPVRYLYLLGRENAEIQIKFWAPFPDSYCPQGGGYHVPTTGDVPSTTEVPSTADVPSTAEVPSTTEVPKTNLPSMTDLNSKTEAPSTTEAATTTEVKTTTEIHSLNNEATSTEKAPTAQANTTAEVATSIDIPSATEAATTTEAAASIDISSTTEANKMTDAVTTTEAATPTEAATMTDAVTTTEAATWIDIPSTTEAYKMTDAASTTETTTTTEAATSIDTPSTTEANKMTDTATTTEAATTTEVATTTGATTRTEAATTTEATTTTEAATTTKARTRTTSSTTEDPPTATKAATVGRTTQAPTTVSPEPPKFSREQFGCRCVLIPRKKAAWEQSPEEEQAEKQVHEEAKQQAADKIKATLTVGRANVSSAVRRYVSAGDERSSSRNMAVVVGVICFMPLTVIVVADIVALLRAVVLKVKDELCCSQRSGKT